MTDHFFKYMTIKENIYKFECEFCKDYYIGSTMKQSKVCFCQHLGISPCTNRPTTLSHSSPRQHCEEKNHHFQQSNFSIIDSANSELELRILESLHILQKHPPLNKDQSCIPLSLFKLNNN